MDLKRLLMLKGFKQIEVSKLIGVHHSLISLQLNKHRLLPKKHREKFCEILGVSEEELNEFMNAKVDSHD